MIYIDLILNLSLLVALSVVSGFIENRWDRHTRLGLLFQGVLFGGVAALGMLRPLDLGQGLIFDGRSIMISLCALFFGPWAAAISGVMAIVCRMWLGGAGGAISLEGVDSSVLLPFLSMHGSPPCLLRVNNLSPTTTTLLGGIY